MEIERKFTVRTLPVNLDSYPCRIIEQAYLNTDPVVRIRREDDSYYLTYKGKGLLAREEYNLPLNEESYYHLREKADGNIISKKRYVIPIEHPQFDPTYVSSKGNLIDQFSLCVELDIFEPPFRPPLLSRKWSSRTKKQRKRFSLSTGLVKTSQTIPPITILI